MVLITIVWPGVGPLHILSAAHGEPFFYIGLVLVVVGSWVWCLLMLVAMRDWKRENPGRRCRWPMFATVANA
jgi:cytochrome c oxidase subunit 1